MKTTVCRMFVGLFFLFIVFFLVISSWTEGHALISDYPNNPVTFIVPAAPGGPTDLVARAVTEAMQKHLKQPTVVVNKPGAATIIGANVVVTAKPDGYTLGFLNQGGSLPEVFSWFYKAPYTSKDLRPISKIVVTLVGIAVRGDAPWNSLKDLVEFAKKQGGMKVATTGKNTTGYMFVRLLEKAERAGIVPMPMNSDTDIIAAVLGGHVPAASPVTTMTVRGLMDAKKIKILAFLLKERTDFARDIPTVFELGYELPPIGFIGLFGPSKTPDEVAERIDGVVRKIVEEPDFKAKIKGMGLRIDYEGLSEFDKFNAQRKELYHSFFKQEGMVK